MYISSFARRILKNPLLIFFFLLSWRPFYYGFMRVFRDHGHETFVRNTHCERLLSLCGLPFHSLHGIRWRAGALNVDAARLANSLPISGYRTFRALLKMISLAPGSWRFYSIVSSKTVLFLFLFCFHSLRLSRWRSTIRLGFLCGYPIDPVPFKKKGISHPHCSVTCKSSDYIDVDLILGPRFCSISFLSIQVSVLIYCLRYTVFHRPWSHIADVLPLFSLLLNCLNQSEPFAFPHRF